MEFRAGVSSFSVATFPTVLGRTWGWSMQESPDVDDQKILDIAPRLVVQDAVKHHLP